MSTDELIPTPKIKIFLPTLPSNNKSSERESYAITIYVYSYLSRSAFLGNIARPNKQCSKVRSQFKSGSYVCNS